MTSNTLHTIESQALPGVRFVLRRMSRRRVEALNEILAPHQNKVRELFQEFAPLDKERREAIEASEQRTREEREKLQKEGLSEAAAREKFPAAPVEMADEKVTRWSELCAAIDREENREVAPAMVRFVLVRIEHLEITYPSAEGDDITAPATLDLIIEHGAGPDGKPDALFDEIFRAVQKECGLLKDESENLNSPSTSAAQVDGKQGNAEPVEKPEMTLVSAA